MSVSVWLSLFLGVDRNYNMLRRWLWTPLHHHSFMNSENVSKSKYKSRGLSRRSCEVGKEISGTLIQVLFISCIDRLVVRALLQLRSAWNSPGWIISRKDVLENIWLFNKKVKKVQTWVHKNIKVTTPKVHPGKKHPITELKFCYARRYWQVEAKYCSVEKTDNANQQTPEMNSHSGLILYEFSSCGAMFCSRF